MPKEFRNPKPASSKASSETVAEERLFYTYIVSCADDTLYTGWTRDIEQRIQTHNEGTGAKYTRTRRPVKLIASWQFDSKPEAMSMEYKIKKLTRKEKLRLAENSAGQKLT